MHYKYVLDYWKDGNITCMAIILTLYGNDIEYWHSLKCNCRLSDIFVYIMEYTDF